MKKRKYSQIEHDQVIFASLKTYENYWKEGIIVSINPGDKQCHDIGGGHFPDLVVWKPNGNDESTFRLNNTLIIEEVETEESINEEKSKEWEVYSKFGVTFYLIVPINCAEKTKNIVKKNNINVTMIQYYYFDKNNNIKFSVKFNQDNNT